ncbi:glycosyltransferase, partial [Candidatus Bathyarchaeota archaeon]|nr:glycosyltransferase [Candidatus Bathyarchaeota archaeon]
MITVFPTFTLLATVVSVILSVYAFNMFIMSLIVARRIISHKAKDTDPPSPEILPIATIQIPIYNEGSIVETVLENITNLDYPKERMQIQILDDSTDKEVLHKEESLTKLYKKKGYNIELIHRENRIGYKAGALNNGLKTTKGKYVVVVDADTISPRNFLKDLISVFNENDKIAFIQTKCDYSDRWFNWITASSAIERDMHYLVEQPAKNWYDLLPNFSGKSGMWRKDVLDKYGWDERILTEDVELSYRVQIDGWKSLYLHSPTCLIEIPPSLTALKAQQRRWTAGFAQSLKKLWKPILKSNRLTAVQKLETLIFLSTPITHLAAMMAIALWVLAAIFEPEATLGLWLGTLAFSSFMAAMSTAAQLPVIMGVLRSGGRIGRKLLTIPLTLTIVTANLFSNARGAIEGFTGKKLVFERTLKYGITYKTRKHEVRTGLRLSQIIRKNTVELVASILMIILTLKIFQIGQITSAIPLSYISIAWLV